MDKTLIGVLGAVAVQAIVTWVLTRQNAVTILDHEDRLRELEKFAAAQGVRNQLGDHK